MQPVLACAFLLASLALVLTACGSSPAVSAPTPIPTAEGPPPITPLLATKTLHVGTQRVAFLLETPMALVTVPSVQVYAHPPHSDVPTETRTAAFHEWPLGTRGSYVTHLDFGPAGEWRLLIAVNDATVTGVAELPLDVREKSPVPGIGQVAPFSVNKTLTSAQGDLSTITSHYRPDPDLYRLTIADSLITGKPSVIVFASPAYCVSPTCGPEVETVSELKEMYRDEADFIHVEVYDNPHEIQGDLGLARLSPVLSEWGIDQVPGYVNESWVFVLGRDGRIAARFEGYATLAELEAALQAVQ